MTHPFKVTVGYFKDADSGRDSIRVGITNTSTAPFNRVELAWLCQVPHAASQQLRTQRIPFLHAEGEDGKPLAVGQKHTFVIPPAWLFEVVLLIQATPKERSLGKGVFPDQLLTDETYATRKGELFEYVSLLDNAFPNWTVVPGREDYLFRASAVLQALGVLGFDIYTKVEDAARRKEMILAIGEKHLNWKRTNVADWQTVIGQVKRGSTDEKVEEVSPASSRQAIDGSIRFLRDRSGLTKHLEKDTHTSEPAKEKS